MSTHALIESPNNIVTQRILCQSKVVIILNISYMAHRNPRQAKVAEIAFVVRWPYVLIMGNIAAVVTDKAI